MSSNSGNANSCRDEGRSVLGLILFCDIKRILSVFHMMQIPAFQSLIKKINLCFTAKITQRWNTILWFYTNSRYLVLTYRSLRDCQFIRTPRHPTDTTSPYVMAYHICTVTSFRELQCHHGCWWTGIPELMETEKGTNSCLESRIHHLNYFSKENAVGTKLFHPRLQSEYCNYLWSQAISLI